VDKLGESCESLEHFPFAGIDGLKIFCYSKKRIFYLKQDYEYHLSAQKEKKKKSPWLQKANENKRRSKGFKEA